MNKPKIIIVGAGPAGIAAATKLYENGITDVTILEAENRIGGRVNSVDFGGSVVDLGGQWVHGERGNCVYDMAKNLDLLSTSYNNYQDNTFYLSNGKLLEKSTTDRLFKLAMSVINDEEEATHHPGTFGDFFVKVFNDRVLKEFGNNTEVLKLAKIFEDWAHKFFLCLDSTESWQYVSNIGPFVFQSCEGDPQLNWKDKGYRTVLYLMMKKIPDVTKQLPLDDKIFLNKRVNQIVWDKNEINKGGVTVSCADGSHYSADHVIVTVSVGVLKSVYKHLFVPDLPPYKTNAIEGITLGTVNKILLKFPTKWWPDDLKGFSLLWTEEDRQKLHSEFPHGPHDNERSWLEDVFGFYVIDSHPRVLLGWVVGKMAKEVELLSDEVVIQGCKLLLTKFAGHKYKVPEPDGVLRSKWGTNPNFCGSYVHVSLEAEKRNAKAEDLAKALTAGNSKQTLLFAGEATHSTRFSTVHGAIETGYREAERIINIYKDSCTEHHKIAIIGAGIAGIGAALKLEEMKINDFVVLEAQDEPGGRIKTIEVDNKAVDLGAQWLHGKHNSLYNILKKHDMISEELSEEGLGLFIRNDGQIFDDFLVKRVDFEIGKILEECQKFVQSPDYPKSIQDYIQHRFRQYLSECDDTDDVKEMKLQLLDWHIRFQIVDNSCSSLHRLSAKYWGLYECIGDVAHYNLKYGYKSLVNILVNGLPNEKILYKTEIAKINYDNKTGHHILLTTSDNHKISCDHLIITMSLGVLKEFSDIYPPLPKYLSNSITNMGFDSVGKIFLFFDYKWWTHDGIQFMWKSNSECEKEEDWLRTITGFDQVFNHETALLGWVGSNGVAKMESLSEEEVGWACVNLLRKFLPDYEIPNPTKVFRTQWNSNPWIRGSYCHITPECDDTNSGIEQLAEPVVVDGVPRILLAGEAVHPNHYSTVHGAYESGQQQAAKLAEYLMRTAK